MTSERLAAPQPVLVPPEAPPPVRPSPQVPRRRWLLGAVLLVVAAAIGYVVVRRAERRAPADGAASMRTVKAVRANLRRTVRVSGMISAKEYAAIVAPRMQGRAGRRGGGGDAGQLVLVKLAKAGSRIKKGDVAAEFDRQSQLEFIDDQQAQVAQAEAVISKRKAELDVVRQASMQSARMAKAEMEKARLELKTAEVRSEIDAEKLKLAVEETTARAKQLEEELRLQERSHKADIRGLEIQRDRAKLDKRRAEINAEKMVMRAPIDGIVVMQTTFRGGQPGQVQEGDQVYPGSYFMQIVEPAVMMLNGTVNQAESEAFRLGQKAEIRLDAYPGQVWSGRLVSLGAMASSSTSGFSRGGGGARALYVKQIPVRFTIEAQDARIIPDLSASATVLLEEEKDAVVLPLEALEQENGKFYIYVRQSGQTWARRAAEVGLTNETHAAVRSGLTAGEEVSVGRPAVATAS